MERNGKIYKVVNSINDKIYIGSTQSQYLSKRMGHHRENCIKAPTVGKLYPAMTELGIENFKIILLETIKFINKEELRAKEYEWIKQLNTVEIGYNSVYKDGILGEESMKKFSKSIVQAYKNGKYGARQRENTGITKRNDRGKGRWCASYNPEHGVSKSASFSVLLYGEEEAKQMAIDWRKEMIKDLDKYN